jgi:CDP-2,3-bis-(O-geranylgeranyl)-sn-glycerol synthase
MLNIRDIRIWYHRIVSMDGFLLILIQSLWFSLPMYAANMVPILVKDVPFLDVPVDLGKVYKGRPLLGSHKTYRGFVFGISSALFVVWLQQAFFLQGGFWQDISLLNYGELSFIKLGFLLGFGSLAGDALKSFFKRRREVPSGESWYIFDQIDFPLGGLIFVSVLYIPPIQHLIVILVVAGFGSLGASYIGYYLGLKKSKM